MTVQKLPKVEMSNVSDNLSIPELPVVSHYLSTGCTILDLAIADRLPGGFGGGRISHIYGVESSSKSMLVAEVLRSAQVQGGLAVLADAEGTFDKQRAELLHGLNVHEQFQYYAGGITEEELSIESLFDTVLADVLKQVPVGVPSAFGIDSLSAIPSMTELDEEIGKSTFGVTRAKALSKAFRKYIWALAESNLALIFVDQTRQDLGITFGKKYTFSGGEALKFYASTRVLLSVTRHLTNKYKNVEGIEVRFKVDKNKIAPPFREGLITILFDYGIDDIGTSVQWLQENDPDYPVEKGYQFVDKKFRSLNDCILFIEDGNFEDMLQREVYRVWKLVYAPGERKRKIR